MQVEHRRVALLLNLQIGYCRRVVTGIAAYAARRNWLLEEMPANHDAESRLMLSQPYGIIGHVLDTPVAEMLVRAGRPVVSISSTITDLPFPTIDVDHHSVGRLAAEHLLELGYRTFAFLGSATAGFSLEREIGFSEELSNHGFAVESHHAEYVLRPPFDRYTVGAEEKTKLWLENLPKPVGVLCSNDEHARMLSFLCQSSRIPVPQDVALLGVDNDETICNLCFPPISSVDNPAEEIGYRAADLLEAVAGGRIQGHSRKSVDPIHIVERQSTDRLATENPVIRSAIAYIQRNLRDLSLSVNDVAEHLGVSRRKVERSFSDTLGITVLTAIHRHRIRRARQLLYSTDLSIATVARECGYSNHRRLAKVLKSQTGFTPTNFRNLCQFNP